MGAARPDQAPTSGGAGADGASGASGASGTAEPRESQRARAGTEEQRVFEAASMYYVQAETMEVIARHLHCSRSTVSRLLARARREGVVRIELVRPGGAGGLEARFEAELGVRARIVPVREGTTEIHRLQQVAAATSLMVLPQAEPTTIPAPSPLPPGPPSSCPPAARAGPASPPWAPGACASSPTISTKREAATAATC